MDSDIAVIEQYDELHDYWYPLEIRQKLKNIKWINDRYDEFRINSIITAVREQDLLKRYVDIIAYPVEEQYGTFELEDLYIKEKVRALHAFQVELINKEINNGYNKYCLSNNKIKI